jgi:ketosteroid isomerase-like protein
MAQVLTPTDLIRSVFTALDARDPAAVATMMTDDVRLRFGNADVVEGKAAFLDASRAFVASINATRHEVHSIWSIDDVVIAEMDVHYERLDEGRVTLPCCNVFRVRDGLVSDYRIYVDIAPVYAQPADDPLTSPGT